MGHLRFTITAKDRASKARTGLLKLRHGSVQTPELMPVATKASVKALSSEDLEELGSQILICNTYHLMLKPGAETIEKLGGLNQFMDWKKPIVTDSGGFQAFSLGLGMEHATGKMALYFPEEGSERNNSRKPQKSIAKITDRGIQFKSVYDNSKQYLTPEKSIMVQEQLGADMILAFDECTSPLSDRSYTEMSLGRTHRWAQQCIDAHKTGQALAGIVQGGHWQDLREKSAKFISSLPFDSIAIGGSLGKSKKDMHQILECVMPHLPEDKPRHLLGIGVVEDIFEGVERGVDLFDCVTPTRMARAGYAYIKPPSGNKANKYRYKITSIMHAQDASAIDAGCRCRVCRHYTRAYINHLFKADELLAYTLLSYHNIHFFVSLMKDIREAIDSSSFLKLKRQWGL